MNEKYIGKICPYCKTRLAEEEEIVICNVCEMPHHLSCWEENQGCTTFGCNGTMKKISKEDLSQEPIKNIIEQNLQQEKKVIDSKIKDSLENKVKNIEKIYESNELIFNQNIPVVIENKTLIIDKIKNKLYARCIFRSITDKEIKAMLVEIQCIDIWGTNIGDPIEVQYLDLKTKRESKFGQTKPIEILNDNARKFTVIIKKVLLDDKIIMLDEVFLIKMKEPKLLSEKLDKDELIEEYRNQTTNKARFIPDSNDQYWMCTCGALNYNEESHCNYCGSCKTTINESLNYEKLNEIIVKRKEEKRRAEEEAKTEEIERRKIAEENVAKQKIYDEAKKLSDHNYFLKNYEKAIQLFESIIDYKDSSLKIQYCKERMKMEELESKEKAKKERIKKERKKKIGIIFTILFALLLISGGVVFYAIPEIKYQKACDLLYNNLFDEAYEIFEELGEYSKSETMLKETIYRRGGNLLAEGKYEQAINEFGKIVDYRNSLELISESKYQWGNSLFNDGEYGKAKLIFSEIEDYKDSATKLKEINYQIGLQYIKQESYDLATSIFKSLGNYKDSATKLKEITYNQAVKKIEAGAYAEAYKLLMGIQDYSPAQNKRIECIRSWAKEALKSSSYNIAKSFSSNVYYISNDDACRSIVYQLIMEKINKNKNYFSYWDSTKTNNAQIVYLMSHNLGYYSDSNKIARLFKDIYENNFDLTIIKDYIYTMPFLKEYIMKDDNLEKFLLDRWECTANNGQDYYLEFYYKNGISGSISSVNNLPKIDKPNGTMYYGIEGGIYYWLNSNSVKLAKVFKFTIVNYNSIKVYCYKDGATYTLYRK